MAKKEQKGVIYILTNPSFPDYIKIGHHLDSQESIEYNCGIMV